MIHYLYHIPHPDNPKDLSLGYIGVTKKTPQRRFREHQSGVRTIVSKAINSYKIDESCVILLERFDSAEAAYLEESKLRPKEMMGWNQAPGGFGGSRGPVSPETRLKRRLSSLGEKNHFYGKSHSEETRNTISKSLLTKDKNWRVANAAKAGKANVGKVRTEESKLNYKSTAQNRPKFTCSYCNKTGQYNSMIAWHGEKCKMKPML
jgi:predicted GIY-YIG superfamily endonuclease